MVVFHNIALNSLRIIMSEKHPLNLILTEHSHQELPSTKNVSFNNGYAKLFIAIFIFKCLRSVTTLLSFVTFLLINITGLE